MNRRFLLYSLCTLYILFSVATAYGQTYKPDFEKITLKNGLDVIFHRDASLPLVSVQTTYHAGSAKDPQQKTGIANIAGEMLLSGTNTIPREKLIELQQQSNGSISGQASVDWTSIFSLFPMSYLETALWIEADRMQHVADVISKDVLDAIVRRLKKSNIEISKQPLADIDRIIYHELYPEGHPYRHLSAGEPEHLEKITLADIEKYVESYLVPSNASISIGGNFDRDVAAQLVEKYFASIPSKAVRKKKTVPELPPLGQPVLIKEDAIVFNRLLVVFPTVPSTDPDYSILKLIAKLLSGSGSSRFQRTFIQENPLGISVAASQNSQELDGNFTISITCKPEARLMDIYEQLMQNLTTLGAEDVSDDELQLARNLTDMDFYTPLEKFFGAGGRCDLLNLGNLYSQNPLFFFNQAESHGSVTPASIRIAAKKYFAPTNQLIFSVVPIGKKELGVSFK